jgi:hypothetical protein
MLSVFWMNMSVIFMVSTLKMEAAAAGRQAGAFVCVV